MVLVCLKAFQLSVDLPRQYNNFLLRGDLKSSHVISKHIFHLGTPSPNLHTKDVAFRTEVRVFEVPSAL